MRVIAISPKAKRILSDKMGGDPRISIQQRSGNKVMFSSRDGKFCAWADLAKDPNWLVVLS